MLNPIFIWRFSIISERQLQPLLSSRIFLLVPDLCTVVQTLFCLRHLECTELFKYLFRGEAAINFPDSWQNDINPVGLISPFMDKLVGNYHPCSLWRVVAKFDTMGNCISFILNPRRWSLSLHRSAGRGIAAVKENLRGFILNSAVAFFCCCVLTVYCQPDWHKQL